MAEWNDTGGESTARRPLSLRLQVALMLAFATLPVGVLAVAQGYAAFTDSKKLLQETLTRDARKQSAQEKGAIREAFGALDALLSQIDPEETSAACSESMRAFVVGNDHVSFAGVTGEDGVMRCGHPLAAPLDLTQTASHDRFVQDPRRTVTVFQNGPLSGKPVVTVSTPIWRDGRLAGSIAVSLPSLYMTWASAPERDVSSRFAIVDAAGQAIAHAGETARTGWLPRAEDMPALLDQPGRSVVAISATGDSRIYTATDLFMRDIFAVSSWPEDMGTGRMTLPRLLTLLLPLIMWALAVTVAYFAVDRFALRHVVYLDRLVSAYARSGRSLRASGMREAPLEFAALGESFDRMAQEIESREDALRHSIDEKDALLKEVYHRVRNNLQMIVSLMNLQLRTVTDEQERETMQRLQDRILGLAAVHKRLSEAEKVNAIRLDTMLVELVTNARDGREAKLGEIGLTFDLIEHVEGPDRALPLALFTSEAVANAFKHGMEAGGASGALSVTLREAGGNMLRLVISNVCGRSLPFEEESTGLGSQLIDSFARQLRGHITRDTSDGRYTLSLEFPRAPSEGAGRGDRGGDGLS